MLMDHPMLSWLWHRIAGHTRPSPAPRIERGPRVRFDDVRITVPRRDGKGEDSLAWVDLRTVTIVTSDAGPQESDLFWVLQGQDRRRSLVVAMGQTGEHDFLRAMQERLAGFDNMGVVEAMGSTDNASFIIWEHGKRDQGDQS